MNESTTDRRQREQEYIAFLQRKVDLARQYIAADEGRSNEEVEAEFAALRENIGRKLASRSC